MREEGLHACAIFEGKGSFARVLTVANLLEIENQDFQMSALEITNEYLVRLSQALAAVDREAVAQFTQTLLQSRNTENTVFIAGNGGSASTANHVALDWMLGTGMTNPPLRVLSLASSSETILATGNDQDFDSVFARQLKHLGKPGDVLVLISASGNSPNLISAASVAKGNGIVVCGFLGFDGGVLGDLADLVVHVPTAIGDYGVAEDVHLALGHIVKEILMNVDASEDG